MTKKKENKNLKKEICTINWERSQYDRLIEKLLPKDLILWFYIV